MTYKEALEQSLVVNYKNATEIQKLIKYAYWAGRESATKLVCDISADIFARQHKRAENCRYHKMAQDIVGPMTRIYSDEYAGEYTKTFQDAIAPEI